MQFKKHFKEYFILLSSIITLYLFLALTFPLIESSMDTSLYTEDSVFFTIIQFDFFELLKNTFNSGISFIILYFLLTGSMALFYHISLKIYPNLELSKTKNYNSRYLKLLFGFLIIIYPLSLTINTNQFSFLTAVLSIVVLIQGIFRSTTEPNENENNLIIGDSNNSKIGDVIIQLRSEKVIQVDSISSFTYMDKNRSTTITNKNDFILPIEGQITFFSESEIISLKISDIEFIHFKYCINEDLSIGKNVDS